MTELDTTTSAAGVTRPTGAASPDEVGERRIGRGRIVCDGLVRIYQTSEIEVVALQGLDLHVEPGELITIVGASGSGKSTLLNVLGGLDVPTAGRARVGEHDLLDMDADERTRYRRETIGFVWQQTGRNLLPYLDARSNVEFPLALAGVGRRARRARAELLLDLVGLADRGRHRPGELSGGEQQRVAIAVALANEPAVLLADEPTGELDTVTAGEVFDVLRAANRELGVTGIVVTHDPLVSDRVGRTLTIRDGRISSETLRDHGETEHHDDPDRVISREYAVLDAAGRLQLPESYVDALALERRVRLELEPDHIGVWPESAPVRRRPSTSVAASDPSDPGDPFDPHAGTSGPGPAPDDDRTEAPDPERSGPSAGSHDGEDDAAWRPPPDWTPS